MSVTLQVEGLDKLARAFRQLPAVMNAGVKVIGDPVNYWAEWEWGSTRLEHPGLKTLWSVNPAGDEVILTRTAPYGYIRINRHHYVEIIKDEYSRINWSVIEPANMEAAVKALLDKAAIRCTQIISQAAPIDTGELQASIVPARVGDQSVKGTSNAYGDTQFEIGDGWY
jgi:hypothetical protein